MKRTGGVCASILAVCVLCLAVPGWAAGPPETAAGTPATSQEEPYVVKKGDTLWGISRSLLQDPLLWPRLWEKNPAISDPNRIYPGDQLAIPGKVLAPPPVAEAPKPEPAKPQTEVAPPIPPQEASSAPVQTPAKAKEVPPPPPPVSEEAAFCAPVLLPEAATQNPGIGGIVKSADNRALLSQEDQVVLGLDGPQSLKAGDRLAVVRQAQRVIHPLTRQIVGRVLQTLGMLEVIDSQDRVARARISYSCAAISVGDRVVPFARVPFPTGRDTQPPARPVEGRIVDTLRSDMLAGVGQLIFVDVGQSQGVGPGDVFAVYRVSQPVANSAGVAFAMPPVRLGEVVAIRVTDGAMTAFITASAQEMRIGDSVVLSRQIKP